MIGMEGNRCKSVLNSWFFDIIGSRIRKSMGLQRFKAASKASRDVHATGLIPGF